MFRVEIGNGYTTAKVESWFTTEAWLIISDGGYEEKVMSLSKAEVLELSEAFKICADQME